MKVDLHTHSQASDGQYPPEQVVAKAKEAGVACLALTDHDTLDGLEEAEHAAQQSEIHFVRGVELGTREDRHLHILGLGLVKDPPALVELCRKLRVGRDKRKYRIIRFLEEKGISIPLEEVEEVAGGNIIARPHFAQVLLRHGYVATIREAFEHYLDTDEYQRIDRFKADIETCINVIHEAGGLAVLAHPYQLGYEKDRLELLITGLKEAGLDGLECYYPRHTEAKVKFYLELAQKYELHVTAGSDFHGELVRPDTRIKPVELDVSWLREAKGIDW